MCGALVFACSFLVTVSVWRVTSAASPHILHFQVNDLGWNDVGWRAQEFQTPFLNSLKQNGMELTSYYTPATGVPSRVAMATGKYPYTIGYPRSVTNARLITNFSLSLDHKILPKYLQDKGYNTHLIGNWVLGICGDSYVPWNRGFHSFYGTLGSYTDHFNHTHSSHGAYDLRFNEELDYSAEGQYSTTLFSQRAVDIITQHKEDANERPLFIHLSLEALHKPLQAPSEFQDACSGIADNDERRMRCAMMAAVDAGAQGVLAAMDGAGYSDNLLVLFTGLNEGNGKFGSTSYPLRGWKGSMYEGGTRVPAFLHGPSLLPAGKPTFGGLIHAVDILPTLLAASGVPDNELPTGIDGVSAWATIKDAEAQTSGRSVMIYDIDTVANAGAIRDGSLKLVYNSDYANKCKGWKNYPGKRKKVPCKEWELYDLDQDPSEETDLSEEKSSELTTMKQLYEGLTSDAVPVQVHVNVTANFPENNGDAIVPNAC